MLDKYHGLRIALIAALLPGIVISVTESERPAPAKQALGAIRDCMTRSPAPWPDEWKQEYIETIRRAVKLHSPHLGCGVMFPDAFPPGHFALPALR